MELQTLARVPPSALRALLQHEARQWLTELGWEHSTPAKLLCDAARQGRLGGLALVEGGRALAYSYYSVHDAKALLGGVHELPTAPSTAARGVLQAALTQLQEERPVARIESQLLHFTRTSVSEPFRQRGFRRFPRLFMRVPLRTLAQRLPADTDAELKRLETGLLRGAAEVVYASFADSLEREMSDSYSSIANCEAFLRSVVLRHACGRLVPEASFVVWQRGRAHALVVNSRIGPRTAHVVQLSVHPTHQGQGLGRSLIAASSARLRQLGYQQLTLSVSLHNRRAHEWYARLGFEPRRPFDAWVWERQG